MEAKLADLIVAQFGVTVLAFAIVAWTLFKMGTEFAKARTQASYEVNRQLLAKRFEAYTLLWTKMGPLAIYGDASFGRADAQTLERELSTWYFSDKGGLLLTAEARDFYFALQGALHAAGKFPDWRCEKRPTDTRTPFNELIAEVAKKDDRLTPCERLIEKKTPERMKPGLWLDTCKAVMEKLADAKTLQTPEGCDLTYCAIQQISSILRTRLAAEVRSRLAVDLPR